MTRTEKSASGRRLVTHRELLQHYPAELAEMIKFGLILVGPDRPKCGVAVTALLPDYWYATGDGWTRRSWCGHADTTFEIVENDATEALREKYLSEAKLSEIGGAR